jgi:hypothetical protein
MKYAIVVLILWDLFWIGSFQFSFKLGMQKDGNMRYQGCEMGSEGQGKERERKYFNRVECPVY